MGVVVSSAEEGAEGGSMTAGGGERKEGESVERSGEMTKKVRTQRPHRDDECFVQKTNHTPPRLLLLLLLAQSVLAVRTPRNCDGRLGLLAGKA